jgi:hypothetical protein
MGAEGVKKVLKDDMGSRSDAGQARRPLILSSLVLALRLHFTWA